MTTWCIELTHWKRHRCWERLKAGGERDHSGWDGWMASLSQWTWVWVSSRSWWRTGKPGVLQSMGLQRVRHNWVTEPNEAIKSWSTNITQKVSRNCKNYRTVSESGANALNFDHITQLGWESDQKGKLRQQAQHWVTCAKPYNRKPRLTCNLNAALTTHKTVISTGQHYWNNPHCRSLLPTLGEWPSLNNAYFANNLLFLPSFNLQNLSFSIAQDSSFLFVRWDAIRFMNYAIKPIWSINLLG